MAETGRQGGCGGTKGLRGWEEGSTRLEAEHPSPPCPQTHGGGGSRLWLSPREKHLPHLQGFAAGAGCSSRAPMPSYPPSIIRAAGWEFARLSPTFPAGSGRRERLPWQLLLRRLERSRTRGSPRGERHDTAGAGWGAAPRDSELGEDSAVPVPDERPQSPCGVGENTPERAHPGTHMSPLNRRMWLLGGSLLAAPVGRSLGCIGWSRDLPWRFRGGS